MTEVGAAEPIGSSHPGGEGAGFITQLRARGGEAEASGRGAGLQGRRRAVEWIHIGIDYFLPIPARREKAVEDGFSMLHQVCAFIAYRSRGLVGRAPIREGAPSRPARRIGETRRFRDTTD
jgi:hypothetical protein